MINTGSINGRGGLQVSQMLNSLGLPANLGDLMGARAGSAQTQMQIFLRTMGNVANFTPTQLDTFFGRGLPSSQSVPAPYDALAQNRQQYGSTYFNYSSYASFTPQGAIIGRSVEYAINSDPRMQSRLNAVAGGTVVPDGRADGQITVQRYQPYNNVAPYTDATAANPTATGIYASLAKLENNILGVANGMVSGGANSASWSLSNPNTQALADSLGMKPPLAFEDLLYLMMMQYGQNKEKDITNKMNELSQNGGQGTTGTATTNPYAAYAGTGQVGNSLYGGLVGGPVGSNYGVTPQQLQQYFGNGVSTSSGTSSSGNDDEEGVNFANVFAAPASSGTTGTTGTNGAFGDTSKTSDTLKGMQLQKLMEDLRKMYEMLSNVMKSMHEMQMKAIQNLR